MRLDRDQTDRGSLLDRRGGISIPILLAGIADSISSGEGSLEITHLLIGHADSISSGRASLLVILEGIADSISSGQATMLVTLSGHADTISSAEAALQITHLLAGHADSVSDGVGVLQITHLLAGHADSITDALGMLRLIDSWTFTFAGTLAAGKTICIDGRDFTVKNDGVNAIASFTGEFPSVFTGTNWVIYTDAEGSRTITLIVHKQDRKV